MPFGMTHKELLTRIIERALQLLKSEIGGDLEGEVEIKLYEMVHPEILKRWLVYSLERKANIEVSGVASIRHSSFGAVRTLHFPLRRNQTIEEYLTFQAQNILALPLENGALISPLWDIAEDSLIRTGVVLHGEGKVESGAVVSFYSYLKNCEVKSGAVVREFSHCVGAVIGENSIIGPYARLREGTVLSKEVRIGNFVEIKNSRISEGVNANHLSYIGDATVERNVNIGAGTITCNYDGVKKNPTFIGEESFIGSNTALVAPIKIDHHVVVGAGSTLTKSVPAWSLAVARGRQMIVKDWAKRFFRKKGLSGKGGG